MIENYCNGILAQCETVKKSLSASSKGVYQSPLLLGWFWILLHKTDSYCEIANPHVIPEPSRPMILAADGRRGTVDRG